MLALEAEHFLASHRLRLHRFQQSHGPLAALEASQQAKAQLATDQHLDIATEDYPADCAAWLPCSSERIYQDEVSGRRLARLHYVASVLSRWEGRLRCVG